MVGCLHKGIAANHHRTGSAVVAGSALERHNLLEHALLGGARGGRGEHWDKREKCKDARTNGKCAGRNPENAIGMVEAGGERGVREMAEN